MQTQPLRMQRDYGTNAYLNTSPTELRRLLEKEKNKLVKKEMGEALIAWRISQPNPSMRPNKVAKTDVRNLIARYPKTYRALVRSVG